MVSCFHRIVETITMCLELSAVATLSKMENGPAVFEKAAPTVFVSNFADTVQNACVSLLLYAETLTSMTAFAYVPSNSQNMCCLFLLLIMAPFHLCLPVSHVSKSACTIPELWH